MERTPEAALGTTVAAVLAACLLAAALLFGAAPTGAAPTEPTLDLAGLQAKLDDSGTVLGYFKTVVTGSTIETIPMTVLDIVPGFLDDGRSVIFFEATGPVIARAKSIAAGMSGSPLFVSHNGTDTLIGALSYGYSFTPNGLGFATPIEYMGALEADYPLAVTVRDLDEPITTSIGRVERVIAAPSLAAAKEIRREPGTVVMTPRAYMSIGGLPQASKPYERVKRALAARGLEVLPSGALPNPGWSDTFTATFEGGAAVGALVSRGDVWLGGAGTVTYAASDTVVAFGHPMLWSGDSGLYLTNAWVHGIFSSYDVPFKLMSPGAVRGTLYQDRLAGIVGRTDVSPQEVPIVSRATYAPTGKDATATSYMPRWAMDDREMAPLAADIAWSVLPKAVDSWSIPGSLDVTTTIVVSDGTTTHTVTRANRWDDRMDVGWLAFQDAWWMISWLMDDPGELATATIQSVDVDTRISNVRRSAELVDMSVPGGLRVGANRVRLSFRVVGQRDPQTIETTFTLPAGTPLWGSLAAYTSTDDESRVFATNYEIWGDTSEVVDAIRSVPRNDQCFLYYSDLSFDGSGLDEVTATVSTPWHLSGMVYKEAGFMTMRATPTVAGYGGSALIVGMVDATQDTTVTLLRKTAGASTWTTVAALPVIPTLDELFPAFSTVVTGLTKNTSFRAIWDGDDEHLGASASRTTFVRARVRLSPATVVVVGTRKTRFTATVSPSQTGPSVAFEVSYRGGPWRRVATRPLDASGRATALIGGLAGVNRVRARFLGSTTNAAGTSNVATLRRI